MDCLILLSIWWLSWVSVACQTCPIPPSPRRAVTSWPRRVPTVSAMVCWGGRGHSTSPPWSLAPAGAQNGPPTAQGRALSGWSCGTGLGRLVRSVGLTGRTYASCPDRLARPPGWGRLDPDLADV